ncbi:hypothetical protein GCM10009730_33060 [Streptomyces albidochromogenes]
MQPSKRVPTSGRSAPSSHVTRIAWTLHRGRHVLAIPGTGDCGHLVDNVAAGGLRLSEDELTVLEAAHRRAS